MQFNKEKFYLSHKGQFFAEKEVKTITETKGYILFKQNNTYYLTRKEDNNTIEILKDKVEDFTMWGNKEFINECKQTKFN